MFEDIETHKKLSKWIIGTFTACILIYLGIRHISHVADAVMWLKDLLNPLLIGLILALFLNVPLGVIERHLFPKHPTSRKTKMRRPLAILLSFILVIGVFVGVAFLVIPELIDAVSIVISSLTNGLDQLVTFESTADYSKIPFGEQLSQIDIDFLELKDNLNEAYTAYMILEERENDEKAEEILEQCDYVFYKNEEEINHILEEYAAKIEL